MGGSVWPIVGEEHIALHQRPVGFVTTAVGGTTMAQWLPGTANYNAMLARVALAIAGTTNTIKGVALWNGESDCLAGTSQASYHADLATFCAGVASDLGVPVLVFKVHNVTACTAPHLAAIQAAQVASWSDITNARQGPDLSDLVANDTLHLTTDPNVREAAARTSAAIEAQIP